MSQLLQTAKMKLVIYGKLLLVLKQIPFQWNAMLIQSLFSQATGPKVFDWEQVLYSILVFIPRSISEVHFSLNTAHHPLSFPPQGVVFHPEMQFYTLQSASIQLALIGVLLHTATVITSTNHSLASFPHWEIKHRLRTPQTPDCMWWGILEVDEQTISSF